jgi:predicted TIM-barrel fold metal-dependent hydrolase
MVYPLYEKCIEPGIPVNFHTGPILPPLRSKYSHPSWVKEAGVEFTKEEIEDYLGGNALRWLLRADKKTQGR